MAKSRNKSSKDAEATKSDAKSKGDSNDSKDDKSKQDGWRETVESIVVAFVLAFLFRAFEAEAFVIPTGSMAPTLYGRHKEADCQACGFHFIFGASDEIDSETGLYMAGRRIDSAVCPNCRFRNPVRDLPVFKGDRILVNKFPYEFSDPQRWDVPVFKYPESPTTNYIKRMVGLPNETILIKRGDVYSVAEDRTQSILRKKPSKQKVLQIAVYDNNHPETPLHALGWPKRWAAVEKSDRRGGQDLQELQIGPVDGWAEATGSWEEEPDSHSFHLAADQAAEGLKWVRYRHIVPTSDDWDAAADATDGITNPLLTEAGLTRPAPQLITDFCGYNSYYGGKGNPDDGGFWCSDLTLSFLLNLESTGTGAAPHVVLELNEGLRSYRCEFDVTTGKVRLISVLRFSGEDGTEDVLAEADSGIDGTGEWFIRFANVDDRLCLWVDGDLIEFGAASEIAIDESLSPAPQDADLTPVGIAAQGVDTRVSDLLIERDIYYRASRATNDYVLSEWGGYAQGHMQEEHPQTYSLRRALHDPAKWYEIYADRYSDARFELGDDEYLMLGDNSPRSQDSRVWENKRGAERRHAVPRSALVGRAFYIYWPHGIPFLNDGQGIPVGRHKEARHNPDTNKREIMRSDYADWRVPFYPNIWRMKRIR